jgi:formylglycine-generating enzyme required for sulfatase activity
VVRGGSWINGSGVVRSSYRFDDAPGNTYDFIGFRVARTP